MKYNNILYKNRGRNMQGFLRDRKRIQLGWIGQDKKSPTGRANVEFMAKEWRLLTSDEETFILFSGLLR